jgi:hypothetical protein
MREANVAINDTRQLFNIEVLPDEKQATTVCFLLKSVACFEGKALTASGSSHVTEEPGAPGRGEKPAKHWG